MVSDDKFISRLSQLFSVFPTNKSCSGAVDSTVVSQQEGPGFDSELGPSCVEFARSTYACLVSLCVLWLLLTGYSKMPIGLNGCFFSPCVTPAINWQPIEGVPHDLPNVSWDQLNKRLQIMDRGWVSLLNWNFCGLLQMKTL